MVKSSQFIILDRDGVINYESKAYIKSPEEWHPIPGSLEAIALLNQAAYTVVVATNQSGIARGYYTEAGLAEIHEKMHDCLKAVGATIDKIFYCPHHPDAGCACRKPAIGLFEQIALSYKLDLTGVIAIGDSLRDIQAAQKSGCKPILVLTGNGQQTCKENPNLCEKIVNFPNLLAAVKSIIKKSS